MARIRSVHPGLTSDESYMSMSITAKAAWTPLWMHCDDHGIFEWKPIVLKALIFPADNVDFTAVLSELENLGCVKRIDISGRPHGIVRNFARYQRPKNPSYRHFKDTPLPHEYGVYIGLRTESPTVVPQSYPSTTGIPPQRKEEGGSKEEVSREAIQPVARATRPDGKFEEFWRERPRRKGEDPRKTAEDQFNRLVKSGEDPDAIVAGVKLARAAFAAQGKIDTEFVPQMVKWLKDRRYRDYEVEAVVAPPDDGMVEVTDPKALDAWDAYGRAKRGKTFPRNKAGGWRFPSVWPPGYEVPA